MNFFIHNWSDIASLVTVMGGVAWVVSKLSGVFKNFTESVDGLKQALNKHYADSKSEFFKRDLKIENHETRIHDLEDWKNKKENR
ncbi:MULTISPECIES: hypothetical protein [Apilactobacillus]|uniref:hypothetical protein n=1 Tax=Apilactobacillus TaxID=2767877 RepID=UPI001125C2A7|nr:MULTISPECIES: hypothetical protein [Apilactobacillus]TPR40390.1 hypothetical protein DY119_01500 [Apilactobacillus micheneri]